MLHWSNTSYECILVHTTDVICFRCYMKQSISTHVIWANVWMNTIYEGAQCVAKHQISACWKRPCLPCPELSGRVMSFWPNTAAMVKDRVGSALAVCPWRRRRAVVGSGCTPVSCWSVAGPDCPLSVCPVRKTVAGKFWRVRICRGL